MTTSTELAIQQQRDLVAFLEEPKLLDEVRAILPESVSVERFKRGLLNAALDNPEVLKCERASLYRAVLRAATDGLVPDGRQGAIVAYKQKAQWLPMIAGLRQILAEYGWSLRTAVIYENDIFEDHSDEGYVLHRRPRPGVERGRVEGAYAMAVHRDGRREAEVYSEAQIQDVRKKSSQTDRVWKMWPDQMREKTPAHRLFAKIPFDLKDRERVDRLIAASQGIEAGEATDLLYGSDDRPSGDSSQPDEAVRGTGRRAAPTPSPAPSTSDDGAVDEYEGEAVEESDEPAQEAGAAPDAGEAPSFASGRYEGMTPADVYDLAGDNGHTYLRSVLRTLDKSSAPAPLIDALKALADEHPELAQ